MLRLNPYATKKKFMKVISSYVVSIGFPITSIDKIGDRIKIVEKSDERVVIATETIDQQEFEMWKKSLPQHEPKPKDGGLRVEEPKVETTNQSRIVEMIRSFAVENKTPIECMIFLSEMKKIIMNDEL